MPEFLDIIINYYYNDKTNLSFVIEEIYTGKREKIDVVFFGSLPHEGANFIVYLISKILNIKTVIMLQSFFPNKFHYCYDISDCMFCSHISGKRFCIANMQFSEEEYKRLKELVIRWVLTS